MERLIKLLNKLITKGFEPFGIYYSIYTGIVMDIDDPDNLNRIKVAVPQVYGKTIYPDWVYPRSLYSGKGYGIQVLPSKGDLVNITFEMGNPRHPLWEFGRYGKDSTGKSEISDEELQKKNNYWFKTPNGLTISLDDDKRYIWLKHTAGLKFRISEDSIDLDVNGKLLNLGKLDSANEPAMLGDTWENKMSKILDHVMAITVTTPFGVSSVPNNLSDFIEDKGELVTVKSKVVKLN